MMPAVLSRASSNPASDTYIAGALRYDRRGIAFLFGWLLWGDFAYTFFEQIFGKFMPLYLKEYNASNTIIGITTGSIAGLVNVIFLPSISQWSDKLRTRWGRRLPFLLIATPLTIVSLLGVGFAPEISAWLQTRLGNWMPSREGDTGLLLILVCFFAICFHFFNMILVNAYNWLLRDVVPSVLMGRFLSWFRIVGTAGCVVFLWFVFPNILTYRKLTFSLIGIFYFAAFMLMCWKVREGTYPEHEEASGTSQGALRQYIIYFKDCLELPIYRHFFLVTVLVIIATWSAGAFYSLYARRTLGLDYESMGRIWTYATILSAFVFAPMGWMCDKFSSIKVILCSLVVMTFGHLISYFFVDSQTGWLVYSIAVTIPTVAWSLGSLILTMELFPERAFGQFSAGLNVFGCSGMIGGNYLSGKLMDCLGSHYEYIYLWSAFFYALSLVPMYIVFREWKKFGGPKNYVPPLPSSYA